MLCITAQFGLQIQVLRSPNLQFENYIHPVSFKGATFYLSDPFFGVWTTLVFAYPILWAFGFLSGIAVLTFEYRIKQRRWDAWLEGVSERQDDLDQGR